MKSSTTQVPNQFNHIHFLSRRLIPICWSIIFLIVVAMIVASIQLSKGNSMPAFSPLMLIMKFGFPGLFWIGLLSLMARFFSGCCRYGIFSPVAVSSIRWIGGLILVSALIQFALLIGTIVTNEGVAAYLTSGVASSITNIILGIFLVILGKIVAAGSGLEKELELTV